MLSSPAADAADLPQAREIARINNCPPKKVEVYQQTMGSSGETLYRVTCTLPKTVGDIPGTLPPDSVLIRCENTLCTFNRALLQEKK